MDEEDQKDIIRKVKTSGAGGVDGDDGDVDIDKDVDVDIDKDVDAGDEFGDDSGDDLSLDEDDSFSMNDLLDEDDDRCTRIAKSKYDTWPSAYASGAVVKCRAGKIWKDLKAQ